MNYTGFHPTDSVELALVERDLFVYLFNKDGLNYDRLERISNDPIVEKELAFKKWSVLNKYKEDLLFNVDLKENNFVIPFLLLSGNVKFNLTEEVKDRLIYLLGDGGATRRNFDTTEVYSEDLKFNNPYHYVLFIKNYLNLFFDKNYEVTDEEFSWVNNFMNEKLSNLDLTEIH